MHFSSRDLLLPLLVPIANAFPAAVLEAAASDPTILARAAEISKSLAGRQTGAEAASALFEPVPIFNAQAQYVNVSKGSGHEYVAPGPNDLRGPCPGLNAMANHNFLPHNGYATVAQYIDANVKVVGMGPILALALSQYGGNFDGDVLSFSMGGKPSLAQGGLTGILGNGLTGSHNKYETDASPTRPDLYQAGNNWMTSAEQFQDMINHSPNGVVTLDSLTSFRSDRYDTQKSTNPYFFNGPFSGVLVQTAAYTFIYRFMANHTEENPGGILTHETLQTWFGVEGSNGNYKAVQGTERIPENWYRRPIEYPYENVYFVADALNAAALHPKFLDVGGNTGTAGSFTGVNINDLTGGVFSAETLTQGNNLACYVFQVAAQAKPDILGGALGALTDAVGKVIGGLSCPQLKSIDTSQLKALPGYTKDPVYG